MNEAVTDIAESDRPRHRQAGDT